LLVDCLLKELTAADNYEMGTRRMTAASRGAVTTTPVTE